jgi:hypothetical protein
MTGFVRGCVLAGCLGLVGWGVAATLAGCEQSEGQLCQVNSDCADGLVCVIAISPHQCEKAAATQDAGLPPPDADAGALPDAELPIDAPTTP